MKYIIIAIALLSTLWLSGCGYKEGVSAGDQKSFLYFSGNTKSATVSVDDGEKFSVENGRDNQYKIKPGKHTIRVYRESEIIVDRAIYVGDEIAKEINLD